MTRPRSARLLALSSTALALPGLAVADAPPVQTTVSYQFSNYQEDDLPRREVAFGDRSRYDIDVHQFLLVGPAGRNMDFQLALSHESLSGASPWYSISGPGGDPLLILSGASSIHDQRNEIQLGSHYYLENGRFGGNLGYSEEDDYRAVFAGIDVLRHFNGELTSFAASVSYSSDDLFPTDAALFQRIESGHKHSLSGFASLSQIINQTMTAATAVTVTRQSGDLSDPYKLRDQRPGEKLQLAWTTSLRKFLVTADAALHLDYRLYHDDFGISSHTLDLAWHQNLGNRWQLVPAVRYYSQSAADFYNNTDNFLLPANSYQSSDARLSSFGAFSAAVTLATHMDQWTLKLTAERYLADEKYSVYQLHQPGAGLIQYYRFSMGVDFSF